MVDYILNETKNLGKIIYKFLKTLNSQGLKENSIWNKFAKLRQAI